MTAHRVGIVFLTLIFLAQGALAESAGYHVKRLEIQARAFLAQLDQRGSQPGEGTTVEQQLDVEQSTWAEDMVKEDINSLLAATPSLLESLKSGDEEEYSRARVELESLARRLRISTSPLELDPQQQASLDLLMLELDEAASVVNQERRQITARQESRQRRSNVSVGLGVGYSPWGAWGPWGLNTWGGGFYRPFYGGFYRPRVYRRPFCR